MDEVTLECPMCHEGYLHHGKIEIYDRSEDEKSGLLVICENKTAEIKTNLEGNPSARRHGVRVWFYCENCGNKEFSLILAQHKGNTFLCWEN